MTNPLDHNVFAKTSAPRAETKMCGRKRAGIAEVRIYIGSAEISIISERRAVHCLDSLGRTMGIESPGGSRLAAQFARVLAYLLVVVHQ